MTELLEGKGDTDTNAAIVGGLLGCYYGLKEVGEESDDKYKWIDNIKNCKPKVDYEKRKLYQPRLYFENKLVEKLLQSP